MRNENGKIDLFSDEFMSMIEGRKGEEFSLIVDGMCGGYAVFGLVINGGVDQYEGLDFVHLDFKNLDAEKVKSKYRDEIRSVIHHFIMKI